MLREFHGTINASGLCSLGQSVPAESLNANAFPIWAILDDCAATQVIRELVSGNRIRALRLLEEFALSLGSEPNR